MKLLALTSFYVQSQRSVVKPGQEFTTNRIHGNELIEKGYAKFIENIEEEVEEALDQEKIDLILSEHKALKLENEELKALVEEKQTEIDALKESLKEDSKEDTKEDAEGAEKEDAVKQSKTSKKDEKASK